MERRWKGAGWIDDAVKGFDDIEGGQKAIGEFRRLEIVSTAAAKRAKRAAAVAAVDDG